MTQVISGKSDVDRYRESMLYRAMGLEVKGLKRRGRSATAICRDELGLPKNTKREVVMQKWKERIDAN